jgi:hypothetical protein
VKEVCRIATVTVWATACNCPIRGEHQLIIIVVLIVVVYQHVIILVFRIILDLDCVAIPI